MAEGLSDMRGSEPRGMIPHTLTYYSHVAQREASCSFYTAAGFVSAGQLSETDFDNSSAKYDQNATQFTAGSHSFPVTVARSARARKGLR